MDIEEAEPYAILGGQKFLEQIDIPYFSMEFQNMASRLRSKRPEDRLKKEAIHNLLRIMTGRFYPTTISGQRLDVRNVMIH